MAMHVETIESVEKVEAAPPAHVKECPNCDTPLEGEYCHRCGQKRIHKDEFSVKHFFGHLLHEITHLDSNKILKTIKALLFQPGMLAKEYLAGRKGRYINPIRVYLTISAIYFLFAWGVLLDVRKTDMRMNDSNPRFAAMAKRRGMDTAALAEKIQQKAEKYAAVIRFASVLVSGLFLSVLYFGLKKYYVEHLIFSLYYYSFDFLFKSLLGLLFVITAALGYKLTEFALNLFYPVAFVYLLFALRRVYGEPWARTTIKAVVLFVCETLLFMFAMGAAFVIAFTKA